MMWLRRSILLAVCLGGAVLFLTWPRLLHAYDVHRLKATDATALLAACRGLIAQQTPTLAEEEERFISPYSYPKAIAALRPRGVSVKKTEVYIIMRAGFARMVVLGFPEGADQYGRHIVIDGLRYTSDPGADFREMKAIKEPQHPAAG